MSSLAASGLVWRSEFALVEQGGEAVPELGIIRQPGGGADIMQWAMHKPDSAQFSRATRTCRIFSTAHRFTYPELRNRLCNIGTCVQDTLEMQCLPSDWPSSLILGLQIYYPYFYLLRLARNASNDSVKSQASLNVEQITLLSSVTAALLWALWLNLRCLLPSLQILATLSKYNIGAFGPSGDREENRPEEDAGPLVPEHQLDTMPDIGLNLREVERRRRLYGYNEVTSSNRVSWNNMKYLRACVDNLTMPLEVGMVHLLANVNSIATDIQRSLPCPHSCYRTGLTPWSS